jgi:hypothetical protein
MGKTSVTMKKGGGQQAFQSPPIAGNSRIDQLFPHKSGVLWKLGGNEERLRMIKSLEDKKLEPGAEQVDSEEIHPAFAYIDLDGGIQDDLVQFHSPDGQERDPETEEEMHDALRAHLQSVMGDDQKYDPESTEEGADTVFGDEIDELQGASAAQLMSLLEQRGMEDVLLAEPDEEQMRTILSQAIILDFEASADLMDPATLDALQGQFHNGSILVKGDGSQTHLQKDQPTKVTEQYIMAGQLDGQQLDTVSAFQLADQTVASHTGIEEDPSISDPLMDYAENELLEAQIKGESDLFGTPRVE